MEERPLKKSEVLAITNIRRIADQIRTERNDALALAQEKREQVEASITLLNEIKLRLAEIELTDALSPLIKKIDIFLAGLHA